MSPEMHNGPISLKSDIWAFGCILMELSTGLKPFENLEEISLCFKIVQGITPL